MHLNKKEVQNLMWQYNYSTYDNSFQHHGVKGMRWGVRKKNEESSVMKWSKSTSKPPDKNTNNKIFTKKRVLIGAAAVAAILVTVGGVYVYKKHHMSIPIKRLSFGDKIDISKLSTVETILPKNTIVRRMSSKSFEDYSEDGKRIYASYLKQDSRIYKETMPKYFKRWELTGVIDDGQTAYEHVMKTKNEIKIPSSKSMAELYMKATNSVDVDDGHYKSFMTRLNNDKNPEVNKFFNLVRQAGYNAVIDENDAGSLAKKPIILLNPKDDILSSKSHKLNAVEKFMNVVLM